jgi:hypothetical protein
MTMRRRYYEVILVSAYIGRPVHYLLGYTSNKWAFQRASGWKMKDLEFRPLFRKEKSA